MTRVLIVEDEQALRDVYVILFQMQKFDVAEAANGEIAIALIKKFKPDIVILDVLMPVMGGIEFLQAIDIKKDYPNTKVLMLSNLSDTKTVALSEKLGAHRYMIKASIHPAELLKAVNELLDQ